MSEKNNFVKNIVFLQEALGEPNLSEFAEIIGVQRLALSKLLKGNSQPSKSTLEKINEEFGISAEYLSEDTEIFKAYIDGLGIINEDKKKKKIPYIDANILRRDYKTTKKLFKKWRGRYAVYHTSAQYKNRVIKGIADINSVTIYGMKISMAYPNFHPLKGVATVPIIYTGTCNVADQFIYFTLQSERNDAEIVNMVTRMENGNDKLLSGFVSGVNIKLQSPAAFKCVLHYLSDIDTPAEMENESASAGIYHVPNIFYDDSENIPKIVRDALQLPTPRPAIKGHVE